MKKFFFYATMITLLSLNFSFFSKANTEKKETKIEENQKIQIEEKELSTGSVFENLKTSGPVVLAVLLLLIFLSITCWALAISKMIYLEKINRQNTLFIKNFWQRNSLKNVYADLSKENYSPAKEVFRESYQNFQKNAHLTKENIEMEALLHVSINSLGRSMQNAKRSQRKKLERYLPLLAITASTAPFIGLFGTVWGIMNSFGAIAMTGDASLTSVAPGLSEALIATAFGLGAAIPSAIGYSLAGHKIRNIFSDVENFSLDFTSMIEKHLVLKNNSSTEA